MRVNGKNCPINKFDIEKIPKKPDKVLVRFYSNVIQEEESENWQWDEYYLELNPYPNLAVDIGNNYSTFFRQAQFLDDEKNNSIPELLLELIAEQEERLCMLELFGGEM